MMRPSSGEIIRRRFQLAAVTRPMAESKSISAMRPIGVFDSGIGGLTVVSALRALLPNESIYYLGDTARVPYGGKSAATVQRYSLEIAAMLVGEDAPRRRDRDARDNQQRRLRTRAAIAQPRGARDRARLSVTGAVDRGGLD